MKILGQIPVEEAEKIACEYIKKKRENAEKIMVQKVTQLGEGKTRINGTYTDRELAKTASALSVFEWEVKINGKKEVYEYSIP